MYTNQPVRMLRQRRWAGACGCLLFIPLLVFLTEMAARGSLTEAWRWMVNSPTQSGLTAILTACIFLLISVFAGLRLGGLLTMGVLTLVSSVHATKRLLVGQPLFPWDFTLSRQGIDIFSASYFPHPKGHVVAFVAMVIGAAVLAWRLPRMSLGLWTRGLLLALCAAVLYGVAYYRHTPFGRFIGHEETALVRDVSWDQPLNYRTNGLALSFLMNVQLSVIREPADYDRQAITGLLDRLDSHGQPALATRADPVDLIIVMNEAFWDPSLLPGVTFSRDPLPFLHSLPPERRSWLIAPVFGGWTCNSEFELLTSCSMAFLPRGSAAYQQYVRQRLPALPEVLGQAGYRTVCIHPYHRWYWRRDAVYPLLGFQEFLSLESYKSTPIVGLYTGDNWVADEIIRTLDATTDRPAFVFAITMQNHSPYDGQRSSPEAADITVLSGLPADSRRMLEVYARGASDGDRMLQRLAEYVQARQKPTLLVFLGDHLPYLGPDYLVYRQTGYISEERSLTEQEEYHLRRVPAAYLNNFSHDAPRTEMSMCFLAPLLLRQMGLEPTAQMRLAEHVREVYPVLAGGWLVDATGAIGSYDVESDEILSDYQMLQYDLMFGQQHSLEQAQQ